MRSTRFTETQIVKALKEHEAGRKVDDLCRELGVSRPTFYHWKSKYGGMEASDVKRLKKLEDENARLKRMYANLSLDHEILKDVISKKAGALQAKAISRRGGERLSSECKQGLPDDETI